MVAQSLSRRSRSSAIEKANHVRPDLVTDGRASAEWPLERAPYALEASVPGVFVAGDIRHGSVKRVAAAVGEGATAVAQIHSYLTEATA